MSLSWRTLDEKKKETEVCMGCGTFQLNEKVNGLVKKLVGMKKVYKEKPVEQKIEKEPPKPTLMSLGIEILK